MICCFILFALCVACGTGVSGPGGKTDHGGTINPDFTDGEIPDDNDVDEYEPDTTEHSFALISQSGGVIKYKCSHCNKTESVTVVCESGTANAFSAAGSAITFGKVSEKTVYTISGSLHGNIVIDVGDDNKFELSLNGLEINSAGACPITVLSGDKVTLSAKKSTENFVYDLRDEVDSSDKNSVSASVYAECDLDIQGKGSLVVKSVNNNGIHTKKDLNIKNLSLHVDCINNALKGNDGVTVEAGELVLISRKGDGIKTTDSDVSKKGNQRGDVVISGGDILIYAACDGIDAAHDISVDESSATVSLQIFTDKYSKYSEEVTAVGDSVYYIRYSSDAYKYSLKFYNDESDAVWRNSSAYSRVGNSYYYSVAKPSGYSYVQLYIYTDSQHQGQENDCLACTEGMAVNNNYDTISLQQRGGNLICNWTNYTTTGQGGFGGPGGPGGPGGMNDGNTDKGDHSTKGLKAGNVITIAAGNVTISAYDDAVHAANDGTLDNGQTPLGNVTVSGGNVILRSNDDGVHADGKAVISGGKLSVISSYEGIEGSTVEVSGGDVSITASDDGINGTAKSGTSISVSGGKIYVYAGGDGVDSNSKTSYEGIVFSGGKSVIISTGQADSSIDSENGYKFSGGYVIGIGKSGGMGNEATKCQNFGSVGTSKTVSLQKGGYLVVAGIATVKMPTSINATVVCLGKTSASISSAATTSYSLDNNGVYWN